VEAAPSPATAVRLLALDTPATQALKSLAFAAPTLAALAIVVLAALAWALPGSMHQAMLLRHVCRYIYPTSIHALAPTLSPLPSPAATPTLEKLPAVAQKLRA